MTDLIVKSAYEPEKIIATLKKINRSEAFDKLSVAYDLFNDRSRRLPAYERIKMLKACFQFLLKMQFQLSFILSNFDLILSQAKIVLQQSI